MRISDGYSARMGSLSCRPITRGDTLGLSEDEVKFYGAVANNESAVRPKT